jgi:hypothetical protein
MVLKLKLRAIKKIQSFFRITLEKIKIDKFEKNMEYFR